MKLETVYQIAHQTLQPTPQSCLQLAVDMFQVNFLPSEFTSNPTLSGSFPQ